MADNEEIRSWLNTGPAVSVQQSEPQQTQDESAIRAWLNSSPVTVQSNQPLARLQSNPAPITQSALQDMGSQLNAPPSSITATPSISYSEKYGRQDESGNTIPVDFNESAIPAGGRYYRIAQQSDPQAKLDVVRKLYPDVPSRLLDNGDVVMQITDSATGKLKDVPLNPAGIDAHDFIDLASQAPEIASGIATAIATKGRGALRTVAQIFASSAASAITGQTRDVATRAAEGISIRPEESAAQRKEQMLLDMFLQTSMAGAGKGLRILSPFSKDIKPGSMEFDLQQGQKFMKDTFGVDFKATPGEATGSPALKAVEAAEAPQPGSRTVLGKIKQANAETIQSVQKIATGEVVPEERIGEQAIAAIKDKIVGPLEEAFSQAKDLAQAKGQSKVVQIIDDAIGLPSGARISPTMAGVRTIEEFNSKLAKAEQAVDEAYAKVNALPGGTGNVLSGDAAAAAAADIRKELPKVVKTVEKPTSLTDEFGRPLSKEVEEEQVLRSGVPDGLLKALDDLEGLKGGKVSLQTLTNMKRAAYDEIAKTEAVPGVKERWFNKIASAYEQGIDKGIEETGNPELKAALTNAKEVYKKELLPFDRPGIKELAKGEFDTARLSPEQVVNRLFVGSKAIENYNLLKDTLGADNPAFRVIKRAWADTQLASVTDKVTGSVDADALEKLVDRLQSKKPELAQELFGDRYKELATELRFLKATQNLKNLDESEIKVLTSLPNPSKEDLRMLLSMQANRDKAYVNSILKEVADGLPIASDLKPTEFVKRLQNANTPTADVDKILSFLEKESPETRRAIATAQFYKLLDQASIKDASTASSAIRGEPLNLSASKLSEAIGRAGTPERLRNELLLGSESVPTVATKTGEPPLVATRMQVLENLVKVLAPGETKTAQGFATAGGMAAGSAIQQAFRDPLTYATTFAKKMFLAVAYTSETGSKLVGNRVFTPEETAIIAQNLIASEPFAERAVEAFGPEWAKAGIQNLKESIDRFVGDLKAKQEPQRREAAALNKFIQTGQGKVNLQAR